MPDVPIFLCAWHVRMAWAKQLVQKVTNANTRQAMGKALIELMCLNVAAPGDFTDEQLRQMFKEAIQQFYQDFPEEAAFIKYFKDHWEPKACECLFGSLGRMSHWLLVCMMRSKVLCAGKWCQLFRNMPHCNQETTGAIEAYHKVLKVFCNISLLKRLLQFAGQAQCRG